MLLAEAVLEAALLSMLGSLKRYPLDGSGGAWSLWVGFMGTDKPAREMERVNEGVAS